METFADDFVFLRVKDTKADYKLWQSLKILTNQVTGMFTAGKQRLSEENSLYSLHLHHDGPRMFFISSSISTLESEQLGENCSS